MLLLGASSNQDILDGIRRANAPKDELLAGDISVPGSKKPPRPKLGEIQRTVLAVLGEAASPLRVGEIQLRAQVRLDRVVSRDTVASCLTVAARTGRFGTIRVRTSVYMLEDPS